MEVVPAESENTDQLSESSELSHWLAIIKSLLWFHLKEKSAFFYVITKTISATQKSTVRLKWHIQLHCQSTWV